jgi:hypothetical protein
MDSHLICHSDTEGFYVPIDFPEPLYDDTDELVGGMLGSSQRALEEVLLAAPLLGIDLVDGKPSKVDIDSIQEEDDTQPLWIERKVWLAMYEKFRLSIEHGTAVVFGYYPGTKDDHSMSSGILDCGVLEITHDAVG